MQLKASSQVGSLASSKRISNSNRRSRSSSIAATSVACAGRSEEHTSELQSRLHLVCRLLLEKKKKHASCPSSLPITIPIVLTKPTSHTYAPIATAQKTDAGSASIHLYAPTSQRCHMYRSARY